MFLVLVLDGSVGVMDRMSAPGWSEGFIQEIVTQVAHTYRTAALKNSRQNEPTHLHVHRGAVHVGGVDDAGVGREVRQLDGRHVQALLSLSLFL